MNQRCKQKLSYDNNSSVGENTPWTTSLYKLDVDCVVKNTGRIES